MDLRRPEPPDRLSLGPGALRVAGGRALRGERDRAAQLKLAATGAPLSAWQTGAARDDEATSLAVDACGNAFAGGYTSGRVIPGRPSAGGADMFIVRAKPSALLPHRRVKATFVFRTAAPSAGRFSSA